ncbi:RING zinc finger protein, putative [Plasmodium yoelii]|nr:RING zinc finger protein, putative [Plasmodium yoelii]CDU19302.1 E3 ubiquitin-protein ligase, putative [Plasmodium yoelii]VTZ79937.1 RING zinc finger protein, putative [Plasmodium yoelii]|eukprot:XP_022812599.1 RING zinc finger protein, putative [Plasmodium yoelii]
MIHNFEINKTDNSSNNNPSYIENNINDNLEKDIEGSNKNKSKKTTNEKGKNANNKKGISLNYIVNYNRYEPKISILKKSICISTAKNIKNKRNNNQTSSNISNNNNNKKKQYINCNFRYYVLEKKYLTNSLDGDNIEWKHIEKVDYIIYDDTNLACPICLENNIISPRITKCRHIFCFLCILKYFIDEGKNQAWKKCPICFEIINENDLRCVKFQYVKKYDINDKISMCLLFTHNKKIDIKCEKLYFNKNFKVTNNNFIKNKKNMDFKDIVNLDTTIQNLYSFSQNNSEKILKLNLNLGVQFCKIYYLYNPLSLLLKDLKILYFIRENNKNKFFISDQDIIQKAITNIKFRIAEYMSIPIEKLDSNLLYIDEGTELDLENLADSFYLYNNLAQEVYDSIEQIKKEMIIDSLGMPTKKGVSSDRRESTDSEKNNNENEIYFYQSIDGQCIFLDPFVLKLILFEYNNDMDKIPKFLYNKHITYIESFELTEKTKKKYTFLSCLPLGINVSFATLNIDDVISKRTQTHFAKEISERNKKNYNILSKKKKEEKLFQALANEEIARKEKRYWDLPTNTININIPEKIGSSNKLRLSNQIGGNIYSQTEIYEDEILKYEDFMPSEELYYINSNSLDYDQYENQFFDAMELKKKKMNNNFGDKKKKKKNDIENYKKSKCDNKNIANKSAAATKQQSLDDDDQVYQISKSFLDVAKSNCNTKIDINEKKEDNISIGSGTLSINLMDCIKIKTTKKKKPENKN